MADGRVSILRLPRGGEPGRIRTDPAHHRTYQRRGRELPEDIIPLCADCHRKFHNR